MNVTFPLQTLLNRFSAVAPKISGWKGGFKWWYDYEMCQTKNHIHYRDMRNLKKPQDKKDNSFFVFSSLIFVGLNV